MSIVGVKNDEFCAFTDAIKCRIAAQHAARGRLSKEELTTKEQYTLDACGSTVAAKNPFLTQYHPSADPSHVTYALSNVARSDSADGR
ncbi:hypothetical protein Y032_0011g1338 [Ancylostoma ceylanicum]|uniref:Uncharacterized protein n=1 Tax=Ancylostoma ceylanicum TaxID=53326 RepID=A0A016VE57_9BILA|nr:hypothetical protein Y032_0011g1338 [Ancylostoma ceylanicum]